MSSEACLVGLEIFPPGHETVLWRGRGSIQVHTCGLCTHVCTEDGLPQWPFGPRAHFRSRLLCGHGEELQGWELRAAPR